MAEPLAWMLRPGSAGSNTAADHLQLLDEAIAALPPALRRNLMVTCDGAGASHDLVKKLDQLASRRGYQVIYSVGWALTGREKAALALVPGTAWEAAIDGTGGVRERRASPAATRREHATTRPTSGPPPIVHIGHLSCYCPARRCPPRGGYHETLHGRQPPHHRRKAAQIALVICSSDSP